MSIVGDGSVEVGDRAGFAGHHVLAVHVEEGAGALLTAGKFLR